MKNYVATVITFPRTPRTPPPAARTSSKRPRRSSRSLQAYLRSAQGPR
jgi:hypothetical protein